MYVYPWESQVFKHDNILDTIWYHAMVLFNANKISR